MLCCQRDFRHTHAVSEEKYAKQESVEVSSQQREVEDDGTGHADDPRDQRVEQEHRNPKT